MMFTVIKNGARSRKTFEGRVVDALACLTTLSTLGIGSALAADDARLEEIIVTASKRETNLMQTPLAITAFTQDYLDREGIRSARDLAGTAPNVQLGTGADSGTAATIRGVTSTDSPKSAKARWRFTSTASTRRARRGRSR